MAHLLQLLVVVCSVHQHLLQHLVLQLLAAVSLVHLLQHRLVDSLAHLHQLLHSEHQRLVVCLVLRPQLLLGPLHQWLNQC